MLSQPRLVSHANDHSFDLLFERIITNGWPPFKFVCAHAHVCACTCVCMPCTHMCVTCIHVCTTGKNCSAEVSGWRTYRHRSEVRLIRNFRRTNDLKGQLCIGASQASHGAGKCDRIMK